jgi:hypothetical protein
MNKANEILSCLFFIVKNCNFELCITEKNCKEKVFLTQSLDLLMIFFLSIMTTNVETQHG